MLHESRYQDVIQFSTSMFTFRVQICTCWNARGEDNCAVLLNIFSRTFQPRGFTHRELIDAWKIQDVREIWSAAENSILDPDPRFRPVFKDHFNTLLPFLLPTSWTWPRTLVLRQQLFWLSSSNLFFMVSIFALRSPCAPLNISYWQGISTFLFGITLWSLTYQRNSVEVARLMIVAACLLFLLGTMVCSLVHSMILQAAYLGS